MVRWMRLGDEEPKGDSEDCIIQNVKISLKNFIGLTSNKSFKVEGEIEGRKMVVLIDSGVSKNFLATRLTTKLGLKVREILAFTIEIGNGQREKSEGVCVNSNAQLKQSHSFRRFKL